MIRDQPTVMVVDDSKMVQTHTLSIVKRNTKFCEFYTADNGQEAIDLMHQKPVDVVILDIQMPVKDGLQALPELLKINPKVKVIISSALSSAGAAVTIKA